MDVLTNRRAKELFVGDFHERAADGVRLL